MAFLKCSWFELELNNGKVISENAPQMVIDYLEKSYGSGVPPYITNPDNFVAEDAAIFYDLEYTPGTSSEREVNLDALSPIF